MSDFKLNEEYPERPQQTTQSSSSSKASSNARYDPTPPALGYTKNIQVEKQVLFQEQKRYTRSIEDMIKQQRETMAEIPNTTPFSLINKKQKEIENLLIYYFSRISNIYCLNIDDNSRFKNHDLTILFKELKKSHQHIFEIFGMISNIARQFNQRQNDIAENFSQPGNWEDIKILQILNNDYSEIQNFESNFQVDENSAKIQNALDLLLRTLRKAFSKIKQNDYQDAIAPEEDLIFIIQHIHVILVNSQELAEYLELQREICDKEFYLQKMEKYDIKKTNLKADDYKKSISMATMMQELQDPNEPLSQRSSDIQTPKGGQISPQFQQLNEIEYIKKHSPNDPTIKWERGRDESPQLPLTIQIRKQKMPQKEIIKNAEIITFNQPLNQKNIPYIDPPQHRKYICQSGSNYKQILPVKFSKILGSSGQDLVSAGDYFQKDASLKFLIYFKPYTQNLIVYNLERIKSLHTYNREEAVKIDLNIDFEFSPNSRGLITPLGGIYITGAVLNKNHPDAADGSFYELDPETQSLRKKNQMLGQRKQHSVVYFQNQIYVIGGRTSKQQYARSCIRFDLDQNRWEEGPSLNEGVINPSVCVLNNSVILKFSGLNKFDYIEQTIEVLDPAIDQWSRVRYTENEAFGEIQTLYLCQCAQITNDEILVFGGYNLNGFQTDSAFIYKDKRSSQAQNSSALDQSQIRCLDEQNKLIFSFSGNFVQNQAIMNNGSIYCLRKDFDL